MLMRLVYNIVLCIFGGYKALTYFILRKQNRKDLYSRIRPKVPKSHMKPVIWLHGVSLGEIVALSALVPLIRKAYADAFIVVTTMTKTGKEQAKKCIVEANAIQYLPFDILWVIKPFVQKLHPKILILAEGEYWYNLIREVKKTGGSIVVVNGTMTEKSMKRYLFFAPFFYNLFLSIDHFCLQSERYMSRFLSLSIPPEKLVITGNLKFDVPFLSPKNYLPIQGSLNIREEDFIITLGSTHQREEALLLQALLPLQQEHSDLKFLVVPRHPERFVEVKKLVTRYPNAILIDKMGVLPQCYQISNIAIVGGSFVKGVGGHNIFEPIKMGIPTLFGPFMHKQEDLTQLITSSGSGKMVCLEALLPTLKSLLLDNQQLLDMKKKGKNFAQKVMGASMQTWKEIRPLLN